MGVTIQYRGTIGDTAAVHQLIDEIVDIAKTQGWACQLLDEDWAEQPTARLDSAEGPGIQIVGRTVLKGLHFKPHPACEPVWLYFDRWGRMTTPFRVALDAADGYPGKEIWLSTKTKFSDLNTHLTIINLFRYLKKKYIPNLMVRDGSGYWEHKDLNQLRQHYQLYSSSSSSSSLP